MLGRASWEKATGLVPRIGDSVRTTHDCGPARVLKVNHTEDGYSAWCFRCNDKGFIPHPKPSLSELLARQRDRQLVERATVQEVAPPEPRVLDPQAWPKDARLWLYKAGFSNDAIMQLGFYWHERIERVVMPVYEGGVPVFWQARRIYAHGPKYLAPPSTGVVAKYGAGGPAIALTEDILSAARVARATEAWAVLGTSIAKRYLVQLIDDPRPILLMFDPDAGGRKAEARVRRQLELVGKSVYTVWASRDPKYLTMEETKQCLNAIPSPPPR